LKHPYHDVRIPFPFIHKVCKGYRPNQPDNAQCKGTPLQSELWQLVLETWRQDPRERPDIGRVATSRAFIGPSRRAISTTTPNSVMSSVAEAYMQPIRDRLGSRQGNFFCAVFNMYLNLLSLSSLPTAVSTSVINVAAGLLTDIPRRRYK
jgi:hypothetical protein